MLLNGLSPKLAKTCVSLLGLFTAAALVLVGAQTARATVHQGFGTTTPGGAQGTIVHVTTLTDSGPGSLREALSKGNRTVVFDRGGTITLSSMIPVKGAFVTIDGFSAPPPGITLANAGLKISGDTAAHDVIVQGIRIRNSSADGITIRDNTYNIVIDHVSIQGSNDGSIDITRGAFDVTVQWSIMAENVPDHNFLSLVDYQALRITFHHNLFVKGQSRNPHSGWDDTLDTSPPDTVTDIRNNLIWDFIDYGTLIRNNTYSNVARNFYYSSTQRSAGRALHVNSGGKVYAKENYSLNGANVDSQGNKPQPFLASPVGTTDACTAAQQVVAQAGVRPLDAIDQQYLSTIALPSAPCGGNSAANGKTNGKTKGKK
jgi:pectate lyase